MLKGSCFEFINSYRKALNNKIKAINPDIIHIEECTESFDGHNKLTNKALEYLYNKIESIPKSMTVLRSLLMV